MKSNVGLTSVADVRQTLKYNGEITSESNVKSISHPKFNSKIPKVIFFEFCNIQLRMTS